MMKNYIMGVKIKDVHIRGVNIIFPSCLAAFLCIEVMEGVLWPVMVEEEVPLKRCVS